MNLRAGNGKAKLCQVHSKNYALTIYKKLRHLCVLVCVCLFGTRFARYLSADCLGFIYSLWKTTKKSGKQRLPSHISTMFIRTHTRTLICVYAYQYTIELIRGKWTQGLRAFTSHAVSLLASVQLNMIENSSVFSSLYRANHASL